MTAKAGTTLASFAYTYTPNSYVASKTQKVGTNTQQAITYSYDGLGRLTKSTGNALPSTYIYDAVGNRVQWSATDDPTTAKPDDANTEPAPRIHAIGTKTHPPEYAASATGTKSIGPSPVRIAAIRFPRITVDGAVTINSSPRARPSMPRQF